MALLTRLCWRPLVCTASSLTKEEKADLTQKLRLIQNTQLETNWTDQVTHVVMSEIILTLKVVAVIYS
jgi:hypothetical protein